MNRAWRIFASGPSHTQSRAAFGAGRLRSVSPSVALSVMLGLLPAGCQREMPAPTSEPAVSAPEAGAAAVSAKRERAAVDLLSATAIRDELNVLRFEIKYRFTSGSPSKVYLCEIAFPGTDQWGVKPLEAFELNSQGVIRTGIEVGDQPVDRFEITLSEAESPDQGFHRISNTLRGRVHRRSTEPATGNSAPSRQESEVPAGP